MELRPVIINEDFMVLGGNMRLEAHRHLNLKEIWTDMFTEEMSDKMNAKAIKEDRETKTYSEYCNAIIIKDNVSFGEWEWDILANEWDGEELNDYGLNVWQPEQDIQEVIEFNESINFNIKCKDLKQLEQLKEKIDTKSNALNYDIFIKKMNL
tara:strand:- start:323 stop:781 length:459 start_codon:yes stop_codon:yes gene_type:complete